MLARSILVALAALSLAGCSAILGIEPLGDGGGGGDDGGVDSLVTCTNDSTCSPGVCLMPDGVCVQCDDLNVQATPGSAEDECTDPAHAVCDGASHTCRACRDHGECASGVCDEGTCVAAVNVVYMDTTGVDGGPCNSPSTACLTLVHANSQAFGARTYILMAPSTTAYLAEATGGYVDFNNKNLHIIGFGATLHRGNAGPIINLRGTSNVVIEGLTIEAATSATGTAITNSSTLDLRQVVVRNNEVFGVSSAGSLRITRSVITGNGGGGIAVSGGSFTIVNDMIAGNGSSSSIFGGVSLDTTTTGNLLASNTIADNVSGTDTPDSVTCISGGGAPEVRNNIIIGAASNAHVNPGSCVWSNNLYGPDGSLAGSNNVLVTDVAMLMFVSATDYHIQPGSAAVGQADSANFTADTMIDFDGDARPTNDTMDVGADEIP